MADGQTTPLLEQAFSDCVDLLTGFGLVASSSDVERIFGMWADIAPADRHLAALCFMQFDGNRDIFKLPSEEQVQ